MPTNDPGLWRAILDALVHIWPHIYAAFLSFIISLLRALITGGKLTRSILEACLCGTLTLLAFPVLDYFGLSTNLAVAIGGGIAFLGVEFVRNVFADSIKKSVDKWIEK